MINGFEIIGTCSLSKNKQLVISKNKEDEFVIAKRIKVDDEGYEKYFYEKGSIIIKEEDFYSLYNDLKEYMNNNYSSIIY